ncbi:MAG: class I SAM-dependent methyltransferase [Chitinophagaceae bacterium]
MTKLEWTGERMIADEGLGLGAAEHLHRYAVALEITEGKTVLDIACGEGYGTNLIASNAKKVYGIDLEENVIAHAKQKYQDKKLEFLKGSIINIPLENNCIDVIICFETIEHVEQQNEAIKEFRRVLKEEGLLLISTPAKENYQKLNFDNPFHLKELALEEFINICAKHFLHSKLYHQKYMEASFFYPDKTAIKNIAEYKGSFNEITKEDFKKTYHYNIILCSNEKNISELETSFFGASRFNQAYNNSVLARAVKKTINKYEKSYSYRIGKKIVQPFSFLKRFLK